MAPSEVLAPAKEHVRVFIFEIAQRPRDRVLRPALRIGLRAIDQESIERGSRSGIIPSRRKSATIATAFETT
jgi:hypothetical protein